MFEYAAVTTAEMEREHGEGREKEREEEKGKKKNNSSIPTRRWERIFLAKHRLHVTSWLDLSLYSFDWNAPKINSTAEVRHFGITP